MANILIVDDDPAVQMTIRLLLERAGHHITVAGDGRKGLALFEASQFDLLFLDIFMPGMDAHAEPDFLKMATKLGAVASLQKPFRADALLAAVAGCLDAARTASVRNPDVSTGRR